VREGVRGGTAAAESKEDAGDASPSKAFIILTSALPTCVEKNNQTYNFIHANNPNVPRKESNLNTCNFKNHVFCCYVVVDCLFNLTKRVLFVCFTYSLFQD
jgi:hypothetical protein